MKNNLLLLLLIALAASAGYMLHAHTTAPFPSRESAYSRVLRTMTLRCGYLLQAPFVTLEPNTKRLGGMNVEYVTEMAKALGLSLTWTEILPGQQVEVLRSGKADAICAGEGPLVATTSAYLHYSAPIAFFPFHMYVRADDSRFDGSLEAALKNADDPNLTAAMLDGDLTLEFSLQYFPRARRDELPQSAEFPQLYADVTNGKADFVISDPFTTGLFMHNNPGKLRRAEIDEPFAVLPNQMSVLLGEEALATLLSQGIAVMRQRGLDDPILGKYEREYPGSFYRVSTPWAASGAAHF